MINQHLESQTTSSWARRSFSRKKNISRKKGPTKGQDQNSTPETTLPQVNDKHLVEHKGSLLSQQTNQRPGKKHLAAAAWDSHSSHQAILPLLEWEQASVDVFAPFSSNIANSKEKDVIEQACQTPTGVRDVCCLGSSSAGGQTSAAFRPQCAHALQPARLKQLRQDALQELTSGDDSTTTTNNNHMACDVCQIMELAHQHDLNLGFVGDSLQHQVVDGFLCELQRRSYQVRVEPLQHIPPPSGQTVHDRHRVKSLLRATVQSPLWSSSSTRVNITFFGQYIVPTRDASQLHSMLEFSDVLVMGFGLHWNSQARQEMKNDFTQYFASLVTSAKGRVPLLIHREVGAQHFATRDGSFAPLRQLHNTTCRRHASTSQSSWRNDMIRQAAQDNHFRIVSHGSLPPHGSNVTTPELFWIPFYNFTARHYEQHPHIHPAPWADCTHFCSSPYLWYPVWRGLRHALDWKFGPG